MAPVAVELQHETKSNAKLGAKGTTTSGKSLQIRTYPQFETLEEERVYRKQHLAAAYRVHVVPWQTTERLSLTGLGLPTEASTKVSRDTCELCVCCSNLDD